MRQSMGLQRVRHNRATEQQQTGAYNTAPGPWNSLHLRRFHMRQGLSRGQQGRERAWMPVEYIRVYLSQCDQVFWLERWGTVE